MKEVSCRALGVALDGLHAQGIPAEKLVNGLPTTLAFIQDEEERLDWDLFVRILERLEELLGGSQALIDLGREHFHSSSSFGLMRKVASVFVRPRDLYWMGTNWFGRSLFTNVEGHFEDLPDGRVREVLRIAEGYQDCPQLFYVMGGGISAAPRLLGRPDAEVRMALRARQVTYTITPPSQAGFFARAIALFRPGPASPAWVETLSHEQGEINRNLAEMGEGLQQALGMLEELRKATVIGRDIATHVDPAEFAQALEKALAQHVPNQGIALWLESLDGGATNLLRAREGSEQPTRVFQLTNGQRAVGRLEIWDEPSVASPDLLDELIPWIAVGLDNVRANEAIRSGR